MADRQRSQAPTAAALIGAWVVALAVACTGGVAGTRGVASTHGEVRAEGPRAAPQGLVAQPAAVARKPAPLAAQRPAPVDEARARALTERFRERIAHWTAEAVRLSKGQVAAREIRVAACVRELGGADWVALAADEPHAPASNLKLATTAAALILLGSGAQWVTPFEAAAPLTDGTLAGDLVVRASGDPLFDPSGMGAIEERLQAVTRALRAAGLARIRGDLVLDEGSFETPGPGPSWPDPSQYWAEYCALSGGFTANGGVLHAHVHAGAIGAAATLAVHPSPHGLKSSYDVRTTAGTKVDVRVGATSTTVTVKGTLGQGLGDYDADFAHPDPVAWFGALVSDALRASGIQLDGAVRRQRNAPRGVVLAELRSPLAGVLDGINAESRNGVADQVFFSLGQALNGDGTRAGGARAVGVALERLGLPATSVHQVDGSGLSREDRVTARALCALLERVLGAEPESARLFRGSLAVMGQKGTLEERLRGTVAEGHVFAKTGWIGGVSALSGYAEPQHGPARVFSILIEYPSEAGGLNASCFKKLQDELVLLLFGEGA